MTQPTMPLDKIIELGYLLVSPEDETPAPDDMDQNDVDKLLLQKFGGGLVCMGLLIARLLELDLVYQCTERGCGRLLEASLDFVDDELVPVCDEHLEVWLHRHCSDGKHYEETEYGDIEWAGSCSAIMCPHVSYPSRTPCGFTCDIWDSIREG